MSLHQRVRKAVSKFFGRKPAVTKPKVTTAAVPFSMPVDRMVGRSERAVHAMPLRWRLKRRARTRMARESRRRNR